MTLNNKLKAYSWGYWGWSTQIEHFLEAAEAHEASDGFAAPAFADVRIKRAGRAKTFVNDAFQKIVGEDRYRWFPSLGNPKVAAHEEGLAVAKPEEIQSLLKYIEEQAKANRRVLFFCACQYIERDGEPCCHRRLVADILLEVARTAEKNLEVEEWPGGEPQAIEIEEAAMPSYGVYYPLGRDLPEAGAATLPIGSTAQVLVSGELQVAFSTGPAEFRKEQWWLPIYKWASGEYDDVIDYISTDAESMRKSLGTLPRNSNAMTMKTLVMNIERKYFAEILAVPPRKTIEYREWKQYWVSRLAKVEPAPFNLRLMNGMHPPVPEATVRVEKITFNKKTQQIQLHLSEVLEVKNWNREAEHPA